MTFLANYGLFLAKIFTVVVAIIALLAAIIALLSKSKKGKDRLEINNLNEKYAEMAKQIKHVIFEKEEWKKFLKAEKQEQEKRKKMTATDSPQRRIFVLNFIGDIKASAVKSLREEITAILNVATVHDEVVVRLESPGGMVHAYGLATSQLKRIRDKKIFLTVIVDKSSC